VPHVTLGEVTSFRVVPRAEGGAGRGLQVTGTHTAGDEAGVLELVSSRASVSPGSSYTVRSTVVSRDPIGRRGARQRIFWVRKDRTPLRAPQAGREMKITPGDPVTLEDTVVAPKGAAAVRVAPGVVVAGVPQATITVSGVSFSAK
jgi:hypothetical protein